MFSDYELVEKAFAARVVAMDGAPFSQGQISATWRESSVPLTVVQDAQSLSHLAFSVWIQSAPHTELTRGAAYDDTDPDDPDTTVYVDARVKVAFSYHLRATQQTADARLANRAAAAVVRALMAEWTAADFAAYGGIHIDLTNGLQPSLTLDGEWLMIVQDYTAGFELSLG